MASRCLIDKLGRLGQPSTASLLRPNRSLRQVHSTNQTRSSSKPVPIQVRQTNLGRSNKNGNPGTSSSNRLKGGKKETLWQSWLNLSLGTKMGVAFGIGLIGIVGLLTSDYLERTMPAEGSLEQGRNHERKPRLLGISVVDREENSN